MIALPGRSSHSLTCTVVVPFLDEERFLGSYLESLDRQVRRPDRLVLVDDGSTDGSPALAARFAAPRAWVRVLRRPPRSRSDDRLAGAPELAAFLWAAAQLDEEFDVVAKHDADLRLARDHVAVVMDALEADPWLGIAGTYLYVDDGGHGLRRERHAPHHVRGGTRFYRRECLDDISPLPVTLGWDGGDEVRARARGWHTRSVDSGEPTVHLRATGAQDGRLRAYRRWGVCAYAVGSHPLAIAGGAALRLRDRPPVLGSLAYVWGWLMASLRREPRLPDDIRRAKRTEQRRQARHLVGSAHRPRETVATGGEQQVGMPHEEAPGAAHVLTERPPER